MATRLGGGDVAQQLSALKEQLGADVGCVVRYHESGPECDVEEVAGGALLAKGSRYPIELSSNLLMGSRGQLFATHDYRKVEFYDRPLDLLTLEAGFRAGCTVPLTIGAKPIGALTLNGRSDWCGPAAIDQIVDASHDLVVALSRQLPRWATQRVLVCHDDALAAEGLVRITECELGLSVGKVASSMDEIVALGTEETDLIVTDCFVAGQRVDEQMRALRGAGGCGRVLVIASFDTSVNQRMAVRHGAVGYCSRAAGRDAVCDALETVAAGAALLPAVSREAGAEPVPLTPREGEVLLLLDRGRQVKEIAVALDLSPTTVRGYVRNVLVKLGAHTTTAALHAARVSGLLYSLERSGTGGGRAD